MHSWVLVLSGKREVPESFFIDPFTGRSYGTKDDHFLGIESLWNHKNYWINMQDCWNCCKVRGSWGWRPRMRPVGGLATHPRIAGLRMVEMPKAAPPALKDHSGKMTFPSLFCASFFFVF